MTPALLQKIELLTLSRLELSELLTQELMENPVLEETGEAVEGEAPEKPTEKESADADQEEKDSYEDFDYEYFFGEYLNPGPVKREYESGDERPALETFLVRSSSLIDHLNWQINLSEVPEEIHEIAYFIIGNIDEDGYLTLPVEEIAGVLGVLTEKVEEALKVVQSLDPVGVASRNLQECLQVQIRAAGLEGALVDRLVENHLSLLEARKFKEIAEALQCQVEEVDRALEIIRSFSPKPGEKYGSEKPIYIQPDVFISKNENEYQIVMNEDGLPKLSLNSAYRKILRQTSVSKDTKSFIKERFRSALELLKSIDQRKQTIFRVCEAIVSRQYDFLERGIMHLKPMLIKDVAEELGVHSSTISRVVANKYAHTPQGILELRKFFTVGVESSEGGNVSIIQVKETIKKIIGEENPRKPLSDQVIAGMLTQRGIQITRRTVAKYRDQMNVSGSRERRAPQSA